MLNTEKNMVSVLLKEGKSRGRNRWINHYLTCASPSITICRDREQIELGRRLAVRVSVLASPSEKHLRNRCTFRDTFSIGVRQLKLYNRSR